MRRLLPVLLFGATMLPGPAAASPDPLEAVNRRVHAFNLMALSLIHI